VHPCNKQQDTNINTAMKYFNPQLLCIDCHNIFSPSDPPITNTWCGSGEFCPVCEGENVKGFDYEEEVEIHLTYLALDENGQYQE
jgi:hypothetical protein